MQSLNAGEILKNRCFLMNPLLEKMEEISFRFLLSIISVRRDENYES